ncbi:MAG: pitrilysin family protein, partial [Bacteroidota bacterium]
EHMIFKGTIKRKTFHILNYLESVGGDVNAYTTKEKTCLYASIMAEYVERATELLTDITFSSTFPEKEMVKEKQVISEEIDLYRNAPDEAIFEDFDRLVFPQHSLGNPILGTKASIRTFTKDRVHHHLTRSFVQDRMVFSIVGNVSEAQVQRIIHKYLEPLHIPSGTLIRNQPNSAQILDHKVVKIPTDQVHEIIGARSFALRKERYLAFLVLNNLLGGPAMNSRLNLNIREKHGLTYNIYSFYSPYVDSGIWGIYYACEPSNLDRIRRLVQKELADLIQRPLGQVRLKQAKKQLMGQLILGAESLLGQMLGQAKDLLDFGTLIPFGDYLTAIEGLQAKDLQTAAEEVFAPTQQTWITYKAG